jgi:hypothetical protein
MIKVPKLAAITLSVPLTLLLALAVVMIFKTCGTGSPPGEKIPPPLQRSIDSLDRTGATFKKALDSLVRLVAIDTARAATYRAAERRAKAVADAAQHRADSLAAEAETNQQWRSAYDARTTEAVGLRKSLWLADSTADAERSARLTLSIAYHADTLRRLTIEKVNKGLRETVDRLEAPCRIVWRVPCPSRTTSAGLGVLSGVLGGRAVK